MESVNLNVLEIILISIITWIVFKITDFIFLKTVKFDYKKLFGWIISKSYVFNSMIGFLGSLPAVYVVYLELLPAFLISGSESVPKLLVYYWLTIFHISYIGLYFNIILTNNVKERSEFTLFQGMFYPLCGVKTPTNSERELAGHQRSDRRERV